MRKNSNLVQIESNKKEILISKIIAILLLGYLSYSILKDIKILELQDTNVSFFIPFKISYFLIFFLIVKLFMIFRLIFTKKSKFSFTNFERTFHSMFKDKEGSRIDYSRNIGAIFFLSLVFGCMKDVSKHNVLINPNSIEFIIEFFIIFCSISVILSRINVLNTFPTNFMKPYRNTDGLIIKVKYEDYLKNRISDDEPHLTINQNFDVSLKSLPRNDSEKNLIEIKNPNTPINPALVYNIKDKDLADALRDGYVLKAKLIEIKEEGNLEIELSLKEKKQD
jgi:hypothetical protein